MFAIQDVLLLLRGIQPIINILAVIFDNSFSRGEICLEATMLAQVNHVIFRYFLTFANLFYQFWFDNDIIQKERNKLVINQRSWMFQINGQTELSTWIKIICLIGMYLIWKSVDKKIRDLFYCFNLLEPSHIFIGTWLWRAIYESGKKQHNLIWNN